LAHLPSSRAWQPTGTGGTVFRLTDGSYAPIRQKVQSGAASAFRLRKGWHNQGVSIVPAGRHQTLSSKESPMSTHLVFDGVDAHVKSRLKTYWAKKLAQLKKLLVPYPPDLQEIRLTVSHHQPNSQRSFYEGRGISRFRPGHWRPRRTVGTRRPYWTGLRTRSRQRSGGTRRRCVAITSSSARTEAGLT
jgi:hypothetical protein